MMETATIISLEDDLAPRGPKQLLKEKLRRNPLKTDLELHIAQRTAVSIKSKK